MILEDVVKALTNYIQILEMRLLDTEDALDCEIKSRIEAEEALTEANGVIEDLEEALKELKQRTNEESEEEDA